MNSIRVTLILLSCILFSTACPAAKEYAYIHYTTEDGLPGNTVYQIYRDSKGYLWIGTDKGIARYNGQKFETFTTFNGLSDNEVFFFREDKYGRLWFGNYNGQLCYFQNDTFHNAANTPYLRIPFSASHIGVISTESDSSTLILFQNRERFVCIKKNSCRIYELGKKKDPDDMPVVIRKINDELFEMFGRKTIKLFSTASGEKVIRKLPDSLSIKGYTMYQDQLYFYSEWFLFDRKLRIRRRIPGRVFTNNFLYQAYIDGKQTFYTTAKGIFINDTEHIFREEKVSSVTQDNRGNYWIGTLSNGIFCLPADYKHTLLSKNLYKGAVRYAFASPDGTVIFINNHNQVFRLTDKEAKCLFSANQQGNGSGQQSMEPGHIITNALRYYGFIGDNLISSKDIGVDVPSFLHKKLNIVPVFKDIVHAKNALYIKQRNQLCKIPTLKDGSIDNEHITVIARGSAERIFGLARDDNDNIWYSTIDAVYKLSGDKPVLQPFRNTHLKYFVFLNGRLVGYTHQNELLVGSIRSDGTIRCDTVPSQNCIWDKFWMLDKNHLLISTNNQYRILMLDRFHGAPHLITVENKVIPPQADYICSNGSQFYFFKNEAVIVADMNSLTQKPAPPFVFFTTATTAKTIYPANKELTLPFSEARTIDLRMSAIAFGNGDISYQYSVSRYKEPDNWQHLKGDLHLVHPGYGDYIIKLRGKSITSGYSEPSVLLLHITLPWWAKRSSWFFITAALAISIVLFSRWRIKRVLLRKQKNHDKEIRFLKSEFKALNALMNPHFIFNTLNDVQDLFNRGDKRSANQYLRTFADLIRQNMHNVSQELITLSKEISLVENYLRLEQLRFEDHLNYDIHIQPDLDTEDLLIPPLLLQPLVENAIKHGIYPLNAKSGFIKVLVYEKADYLFMEVWDNGGRLHKVNTATTSSHRSFASDNIRKRLEQLSLIQNKSITFTIKEKVQDGFNWTVATISIAL